MDTFIKNEQGDFARDYVAFINESPSPFHAAAEVARRLDAAGFARVEETSPWPTGVGKYYVVRGGAVAAWIVPEGLRDDAGFSIFGCHTDSPCFKLKPTPNHATADGWGQLSVEVYGGMIFNSWLDRELVLAGAVFDREGTVHLLKTGPLARIPQLAIHLDRTVNDKLTLDPQKHLRPVWTIDDPNANIMDVLAQAAGLDSAEDIASYDVLLAPAEAGATFGSADQFIAAARQDNLSSVFAGVTGFVAASEISPVDTIPVFIAFDHEEIGSASRTGAAGPFLEDVLTRTAISLGRDGDARSQMIAQSTCISADAGHSVHPNYADMHDDDTRPVLGRGPLLKINAKMRYASEGEGIALWRRVCRAAEVPSQDFVSNNAVPCGSTIGPITSTRLGIVTVDVGAPMLSMHSAREMTHVADGVAMARIAQTYLGGDY